MGTALKILAARSCSEGELRDKLTAKGWADAGVIEHCIERLKDLNYVNDDLFAHSYARHRVSLKPLGRARLARELAARKVSRKTIDEALDLIFGEVARTRLANPSFTLRSGTITGFASTTLSLLEVTGGVQYQIPLSSSKIAPFIGAGIGIGRLQGDISGSGINQVSVDVSESDLATNLRSGVRIYFSPRWGVRPEVTVVHVPEETFVRVGAGMFFQFGNR